MKIVHGFSNKKFSGWKNIVTIGSFDGVHIGHQAIIETLVRLSRENSGKSVIVTFAPLPKEFFGNDRFKLLMTLDEKIEAFRKSGVDGVCIIPFTKRFSIIEPVDFLQKLWEYFKPFCIVVGYNHHFGRNGEGNFRILKKFSLNKNILLKKIGEIESLGTVVSSSRIRKLVGQGNILKANKMLGKEYSINARVSKGRGVGRTISYPTANLLIDLKKKLMPKDGVYAAKAEIDDKSFGAMLYLGTRPTLSKGTQLSCEVHIMGFEDDIYGKQLKVKLLERIRNEKKFSSTQSLKSQIMNDEVTAKNILANVVTNKGG